MKQTITTSQYALSLIKVGKVKQACAVIQHLKNLPIFLYPAILFLDVFN